MKKIIIGFIAGASASGVLTYILTKDQIRKDTISELREELLEACMKEAKMTLEDEANKPVVDEEDSEELIEEEQEEIINEKVSDYRTYYGKEEEQEEDVELDDDNINSIMEYLSQKQSELAVSNPYEFIDEEEFQKSEWDIVYGKEVLVYHIPDETMVDEDKDILAYEDVVDMLGPEFQRVLCEKGRVFVRNHKLETTYEVYSSNVPVADIFEDPEVEDGLDE